MVEVWRPGGRSEERRPRHERRDRHRHGKPVSGRRQAQRRPARPPPMAKPADGEKRERQRHHGRGNAISASPARTHRQRAPPKCDRRRPAEGAPAASVPSNIRDNVPIAATAASAKAKAATAIATTSARNSATARASAESDRGRDRDKGRDKRDRESGPALRHYASS